MPVHSLGLHLGLRSRKAAATMAVEQGATACSRLNKPKCRDLSARIDAPRRRTSHLLAPPPPRQQVIAALHACRASITATGIVSNNSARVTFPPDRSWPV